MITGFYNTVYIDFLTIIIDCSNIYFTMEPDDENMRMYMTIPHTEFLNIKITE